MGNTCECSNNLDKLKQEVELYFDQGVSQTSDGTKPQRPSDSKLPLGCPGGILKRPSLNLNPYRSKSPTRRDHHQTASSGEKIELKYGQGLIRPINNTTGKTTSVRKPRFVKKPSLTMNDYKQFKYVENIHTKYEMGDFLGSGAFGEVRKCRHTDTDAEFAIKVMKKTMIDKRKVFFELLQNELAILGSKSHPKIIRIVDLMEDKKNYYVVSEIVEGGELFKRLCQLESFTEEQAANIIQQVMLGLNYLHNQSITHRDMKPENILLVSKDIDNFDIKISDLGFAQQFERGGKPMTLVLGSPLYMAPELINRQPYTEKVDIWSLGVITYQLLSGRTPFESRNPKKIDYNIKHKKITFENTEHENWNDISDSAKDFIKKCLNRNQESRASINDLFQMKWIQDYYNKQLDMPLEQEKAIQRSIQKNMINFSELNQFQKVVLCLVSGLSSSKEEIEQLQKEFLRLDKDKTGSLKLEDLKRIKLSDLGDKYKNLSNLDWEQIIEGCDLNNDGVIDFQDFISACIDRKALVHNADIETAFKIIDVNGDGILCREDFQTLFNAQGEKDGKKKVISDELWKDILAEADTSGNGTISYPEFKRAMRNMIRSSWLRAGDRSPSRSFSPAKSPEKSPVKTYGNDSSSPIRSFNLIEVSPVKFSVIENENHADDIIPSKNKAKDSLINQQSKRRDPNCLFSKVILQRVKPIDTSVPVQKNNAENPEENISPEPRQQQGEIISPERNPFRRNRFAIKPEPENDAFSDSYPDPYRGLETPNRNPPQKNDRQQKYAGKFKLISISNQSSPIKQMR